MKKCYELILQRYILYQVSWFPEDEFTIAFGTGEGRVGVFDAIGTNKPPILYRQYHRNTIYKLEWAQLKSEYFLFSCAEGELIAYKKSAPNDGKMLILIVISFYYRNFYFSTYVYNKGRMLGIFLEI